MDSNQRERVDRTRKSTAEAMRCALPVSYLPFAAVFTLSNNPAEVAFIRQKNVSTQAFRDAYIPWD